MVGRDDHATAPAWNVTLQRDATHPCQVVWFSPSAFLLSAFFVGVFLLSACAAGPRSAVNSALEVRDLPRSLEAYDRFRETEGADPVLLAEIAALLLEEEARSGDQDVAEAAIRQLRYAGVSGRPALERLADSPTTTLLQVLALSALSDAGNEWARAHLFGLLDHPDPALLPYTIGAADPEREGARLIGYLTHADPEVRRAAAIRLGSGENENALLHLVAMARNDDEAQVRGAAVRALGAYETAASPALVERLGDAASSVRLAATRSLLRADPTRAYQLFGPWLSAPPNRASIEAARTVATRASSGNEEAIAMRPLAEEHLFAALANHDESLRSQAAVAIMSVRGLGRDRVLQALAREASPDVRLHLARALREDHPRESKAAFRALLDAGGMVRVQAAAALSEDGEEAGLAALEAVLASDESSVLRQVAAHALASRAGRPEELRGTLEDRDPLVRIQAAGGILAATAER